MNRPRVSYVPTQVLSLQVVFGQALSVPFGTSGGFLSAMLLTPTRTSTLLPMGMEAEKSK